jgi:hypothetical protein
VTTRETAFRRAVDQLGKTQKVIEDRPHHHARVQCPIPGGHPNGDLDPSLSITRIEGGIMLVCHCTPKDAYIPVADFLGWPYGELLHDDPSGKMTYPYSDGSRVVRSYDKRTAKKTFRHYGRKKGQKTVLYHLERITEARSKGEPIFLVGSEKDVHALESLSTPKRQVYATCAPMGEGNWHHVDHTPLHGMEVIAIPHRDDQGTRWAQAVQIDLEDDCALGFALPAVDREKADAADHVAEGYSLAQLVPWVPPERDSADQDDHETGIDLHEGRVDFELRMLRARTEARRRFEIEQRPPRPPFDAGTLGEILARQPEPPDRINGLAKWRGSTLITAQRKVGKTTFMGNLCRSLFFGDMFLGCFEVIAVDGDIAYLNYEMPPLLLAGWLQAIGVPHNRLFIVNLRDRANPLASEVDRARLAELLRSRGTEAVIYDPFGRAYTGKSQNDPGEVGAWLAELDRFTRGDVGALDLFLPNHAGWNGERTRGASSLEDWADSIITMTNEEGRRYIRALGRDVDLEEDQLIYDQRTRRLGLAGTGSRKAARANGRERAIREAITDYLMRLVGTADHRKNMTEIGEALSDRGVPHQRGEHRPILRRMAEEGILIEEPGKSNQKLFSINPASPSLPEPPLGEVGRASLASPSRGGGSTRDAEGDSLPQLDLVGEAQTDKPRWAICEFCPECGQRLVDQGRELGITGHRDDCSHNQPPRVEHFTLSDGKHVTVSVGPLIPVYELN